MPLNKGYPIKNTIVTPKVSHHTLQSPSALPLWIHFSKERLNPEGEAASKEFNLIFLGIKLVIKFQIQNRKHHIVKVVLLLQCVPFVI
jgi:hypothetical protein